MKTFLITLLVIIVLFKMLNSLMFRAVNQNVNDRMRDQARKHQPPKPEGEITIEQNIASKNKKNDDDDYADYIEIK